MPELPEVESVKNSIFPYLFGKKIINVTIRQSKLRWVIDNKLLTELPGNYINRIYRRAKYLVLDTDVGFLVLHLGMSGNLRITNDKTPLKHDHFDLLIEGDYYLRLNDSRRFGAVLWIKESLEKHQLFSKLGPEPLHHSFNGIYLYNLSRKRFVTVKSFIMNNHNVVGIGNIYANESLFLSKINPLRPACYITSEEYDTLSNVIKKILIDSISKGGTTINNFTNGEGTTGNFQYYLHVYGRKGLPCTTCGNLLIYHRILNRSTYFCSTCQI